MKNTLKIVLILAFLAVSVRVVAQSGCLGDTVQLVAVNHQNLANPTYSLNPGGITSTTPTFVIVPTTSIVMYTVYVTGTNSSSAVVTTSNVHMVYAMSTTFSLTSGPLPFLLGCGSNTSTTVSITNAQTTPIVSGAVSYSFLPPGSGPVPANGVLSTVSSVTITSPGTWSVLVRANASDCTSMQTFTVQQNTNAPNAVIAGGNNTGCSATSQHLTNMSSSNIPPGSFPSGGPVVSYLWEGPPPFVPVVMSTTCAANASGVYTMNVMDTNNGCTASATINVNVSSLAAAFVHTVSGAQAIFSDASLGTTQGASYYWDFGDGTFSTAQNPTHTYQNGGSHLVKLKVTNTLPFNCVDSTIQSVNVTGVACFANSGFTLAPTASTLVWNAIPDYPWNVTAAIWHWGDGSSSSTLYTTHQYSAAGTYTICLQVTVSCVASSTTCTGYSVYRSSKVVTILQINVVSPGLVSGINSATAYDDIAWKIVPNPNQGHFNIHSPGLLGVICDVAVQDLTGREIHRRKLRIGDEQPVDLEGLSEGVYLLTIHTGSLNLTKKLVISR